MKTTGEKWKLVPEEPTQAMIAAGSKCVELGNNPHFSANAAYRAMLAAAPTPPPETLLGYVMPDEVLDIKPFGIKTAAISSSPDSAYSMPIYRTSPTATQALRMAANVEVEAPATNKFYAGTFEEGVEAYRNAILSIIPPTSEQDSAAQSASESDQRKLGLCPHCNGSGEEVHSACIGPDSYEELGNCSKCGGTGDIKDAYANALVSLEKAQVENMQLRANAYLTPPTDTVTMTREELEAIDIKAEAGLCCFQFQNAREYLKDIRAIVAQHICPHVRKATPR